MIKNGRALNFWVRSVSPINNILEFCIIRIYSGNIEKPGPYISRDGAWSRNHSIVCLGAHNCERSVITYITFRLLYELLHLFRMERLTMLCIRRFTILTKVVRGLKYRLNSVISLVTECIESALKMAWNI